MQGSQVVCSSVSLGSCLSLTQNKLKAQFSVRGGTPALVLVDAKGNTISCDGINIIDEDESGAGFPWTPVPLSDLIGRLA